MPFIAQNVRNARLHLQKSDPVMKQIVRQVGPFQCKVRRDRFLMLVNSIVSQQISGAAARTILSRLHQAVEPGKVSPETLLQFSVDGLREIGISRQKASYILDLSYQVASGAVQLDHLSKKDDHQVILELTQIKGIGVWTAQMFLMFSLARMDIFPVDDLGIQNAVRKAYRPRGKLTKNRLIKIAEPWRPYATIASWYLWRSLEVDGE